MNKVIHTFSNKENAKDINEVLSTLLEILVREENK